MLERRRSSTLITDGSAKGVDPSTKQEKIARTQNRTKERRIPTRLVKAEEYAPGSPNSVATIYTRPIIESLNPQRSY